VGALFAKKAGVMKAGLGATGVAMVAGLVALFALALDNRSEAVVAGPLGKIAYIRDGNVWAKAVPDGRPQRLSNDGTSSLPKWSPGGDWLAYINRLPPPDGVGIRAEVWVMRSDGSQKRRLDSDGPWFGWLPGGGDRLVYGKGESVVVEDAAGGNRRVLLEQPPSTATETIDYAGFLWSPDGRWFVYGIERESVSRTPASTDVTVRRDESTGAFEVAPASTRRNNLTYVGLWISASDGSGARELFNLGPAPEERLAPVGWSADGSDLLFVTLPFAEDAPSPLDGVALHSVSLAGGQPRDLGLTTLLPLAPAYTWSASGPQSSGLALVAGGQQETWTNKRIVLLSGSDAPRPLTGAETAALAPAWSPDGTQIAYVSAPDLGPDGRDAAFASRRIWQMNAEGTAKHQLTTGESFRDEKPMWSADGSHILFARLTTEACDTSSYTLMLLNFATGTTQEVEASLPLFDTRNERNRVGEIPRCFTESETGWTTDWLGHLNLNPVLDWWQTP
jgi:Tol biopolymer transport system component